MLILYPATLLNRLSVLEVLCGRLLFFFLNSLFSVLDYIISIDVSSGYLIFLNYASSTLLLSHSSGFHFTYCIFQL